LTKLIKLIILAGLLPWLITGCSASSNQDEAAGELTVFAAASLTEAFQEIAAAFERDNPGVSVVFNFAGSQRLRTQLEQGAQADVFASADWEQMNAVVDSGLVSGEPVNFASNQLVALLSSAALEDPSNPLLQEEGQPGSTTGAELGLEALARPGVRLVLALPEVPAGNYSRQVIEKMRAAPTFGPDYADAVLANVVSEETNVRNVVQKVALGEADAGLAYQTDVMAPDIAQQVQVIPIPETFNVTASYPIAWLEESGQPELARAFIDFVRSDPGQEILTRHGFGAPLPSNGPRTKDGRRMAVLGLSK
jgi:molybdate transport system substrate-binding protein